MNLSSDGDIVDALPDPIVILDAASLTVCHANPSAERLFGWLIGDKVATSALELVHHDDLALALTSIESVETKVAGSPIEIRVATATGWVLVELTGARHTSEKHDWLLIALRDLTQRRRWEIAHNDAAAFRSIVHNAGAVLIHLDRTGVIRSCSAAATRDLGHDPEAIHSRPLSELLHIEDTSAFAEALADLERPDAPQRVSVEARLQAREDRAVPYQLTIARLDADPTLDGYVVSGHDITQLDDARRQLSHTAAHDCLTGLLNRSGFIQRLEADLSDSITPVTIAFIDLNGFKSVNDQHGHTGGDYVLTVIAERIRAAIRNSDYAGRIGGDEFAVALHAHDSEIIGAITERLKSVIAQDIALADHTVSVDGAIGTTTSSPDSTVAELLTAADVEMYRTKPAESGNDQ